MFQENNEETTVEVTGHPSSTSTPRHQEGGTFLACSSGLEDQDPASEGGGAKPKRSLKFNVMENNMSCSRIPSFFAINRPKTEFVASLTAIFNDKIANCQTPATLKRRSTSPQNELLSGSNIGDTFNEGSECVSRGVQCSQFD